MNDKKYAYVFTIGGSVEWSAETEDSLIKRISTDPVLESTSKALVLEFVESSPDPGMHITVGDAMVWRMWTMSDYCEDANDRN